MVILIPYSYRQSVKEILDGSQPGDLNPGWYVLTTRKICDTYISRGRV